MSTVLDVPSGTNAPDAEDLALASGAGIFDHSFDMLKAHFIPLMLIVAVVVWPLHIAAQFVVSKWLDPAFTAILSHTNADNIGEQFLQVLSFTFAYTPTGNPRYGVPGALFVFAAILISAPVTSAVADIVAGRPVSVLNAYRAAWRVRWRLFGCVGLATLCCFAIWFLSTMVIGILGMFPVSFVAMSLRSSGDSLVGAVVSLVYMAYTALIPYLVTCVFYGRVFAFCMPVCIIERMDALEAVSRSAQLASSAKFRTTLLSFVVMPIAVMALQFMLLFGCQDGMRLLALPPPAQFLVSSAVCGLIVCMMQCFWMVYVARLYFSYRVKRECLDIRMMMAAQVNQ